MLLIHPTLDQKSETGPVKYIIPVTYGAVGRHTLKDTSDQVRFHGVLVPMRSKITS